MDNWRFRERLPETEHPNVRDQLGLRADDVCAELEAERLRRLRAVWRMMRKRDRRRRYAMLIGIVVCWILAVAAALWFGTVWK